MFASPDKRLLGVVQARGVSPGIGNITPKLHLPEEHVVPLMEVLDVGVGLLGEHGAESIHSTFNNYEKASITFLQQISA